MYIFFEGNQPQQTPKPQPSGQAQCLSSCDSKGSCKVKIVNGPPGKLPDPENWIYWSICPFSDLQN